MRSATTIDETPSIKHMRALSLFFAAFAVLAQVFSAESVVTLNVEPT
jgi:hypothetical protein